MESTGDIVGHKHWPVIVIEKPMLIALVPQVPLRTVVVKGKVTTIETIRVHFLACARTLNGLRWVHVEVDGPRHDSTRDEERAEALGLSRVKLTVKDIRAHDFLERLVAKIRRALVLPA